MKWTALFLLLLLSPALALQPGDLKAAAAVLYDADSEEFLWRKNSREPRAPASTVKLLTALVIAEDGNLDQPVVIEQSDTEVEPVKLYLKKGDVYSRRKLLQALLVKSGNDVAAALARDFAGGVEEFAEAMNERAREAGALESNFVTPNGLPAKGQLTTAEDMARIAREAYRQPFIRQVVAWHEMVFRFADGKTKRLVNTNRVMRQWPVCNGMKTGYTHAARFCLVGSAMINGRDYISVVYGSSSKGVWQDTYKLLRHAKELAEDLEPEEPLPPDTEESASPEEPVVDLGID